MEPNVPPEPLQNKPPADDRAREFVLAGRKSRMSQWSRYAGYAAVLALFIYILIYLTDLVVYYAIAAVITILGRPIVGFFHKIRIGKYTLPYGICAALTLLLMYAGLFGVLLLFVPIFVKEARQLSSLDFNSLWHAFADPLMAIEAEIQSIEPDFSIRQAFEEYIKTHLLDSIDVKLLTGFLNKAVGLTGNLMVGFVVVTFMSFYFMSQRGLMRSVMMAFTPTGYEHRINALSLQIQKMLRRYVLGLTIQLTIFSTLTTLGLWLFGVENALFIGLFAGLANLIPYVGPFIGMAFGMLIAVTSGLTLNIEVDLGGIILRVFGVIASVQFLDSVLIQPQVFSSSVKAHPLEILLVILSAGKIGGVPAMIIAVPTYTIIRLIAKQFFSHFKAVQRLTKDL